MSEPDDITLELISAIAVVEGVEPHELDYSLHDYVATDAVRAMAETDTDDWKLTFQIPDHTITIDGDGEIQIDGVAVRETDVVHSDEIR